MTGDKNARLRVITVGQRDAGVAGAAGRCCDAGNYLKGDVLLHQALDFLATAAKYERVTAFEAQYPLARSRKPYQQAVDVPLRDYVIGFFLAHVDAFGITPHQVDDCRCHQPVVEHHIGLLHET